MTPEDPANLTLVEAEARLRDGRLTATALVAAHLARIADRDPGLGAFVTVLADIVRADAAAADADLRVRRVRSPLHGIPIAVKDVIDVAGLPTGCGSHLRDGHRAVADAEVVRRLRAAGAILIGKLVTDEFALVGPGLDTATPPPRNPCDPARITGGSSSGCAAAVAGGLVRVSLGTDSGGSLRIPAAYCGVVALKPCRGRMPRTGIVPVAPSLDTVGPLGANVAEVAGVFDVLADPGAAAGETLGAGVSGLRIVHDWGAGEAAALLAGCGAGVGAVTLPPYEAFVEAGGLILYAEAAEIHRADLMARPAAFGILARACLALGLDVDPARVVAARRRAAALAGEVDRVFDRADALLVPTVLGVAPRLDAFDGETPHWAPARCLPFNLSGHAALTVPCGTEAGLPLGVQVVARTETMACRVGAALERVAQGA